MTPVTRSRAATGPRSAPGARGGGPFTGTGTLLRFNLRRDRVRLPAWLAGIALVQVGGAATYPDLYPTVADRQLQAAVVGDNPAMRAMTGPGYGLADYTFGAMISNEFFSLLAVVVALMSVLLLVRHTRAEEEAGRAELVRASVVGRYAHLTAALAAVAVANLAVGLLVALGLGSLGIETVDWAGSLMFGGALAAVGLVFAAAAALAAQVTAYGRAAAGLAGTLIALAYLLRAVGDVADNGLSWLSPIGWAQATGPYVLDRGWPLGLALAATAVLVAVAFRLSARRDVGAGLGQQRPGAARAAVWLTSPLGFAWRLQRAGLLWWSVAILLVGLSYGSSVSILEEYADNEVVQELVAGMGGATLTESWLSMIIGLVAMVCTVFAVIAVLRPRREEVSGRAEAVLATGLSRARWTATHIVVGMAGGVVLLLVTGLSLGGAGALATGDPDLVWQVLGAAVAYAPALWLTSGLAVAAYGWAPRAVGVAWALLAYAILVIYLGGLLQLPQWLLNLSPYTHVPRMPAADFSPWPLAALTVIAAGLVAAGLAGFRRRDLLST
jgi:ABC-2 type transport system permease protein